MYESRLCPDSGMNEYLELRGNQLNLEDRQNIVIDITKCYNSTSGGWNKLNNCHEDGKI